MTMLLMSFPAFAACLALFALVESVWRWFTGLGLIPWLRRRTGQSLSSIAFDEFTTVVNGNKTAELEQRRVELLRRDDESDGAPPRSGVDLTRGTAFIVRPQEQGRERERPQEPERERERPQEPEREADGPGGGGCDAHEGRP